MRASRRNWREPFRVFGQVIGGAFCVPIENNTLGFRKTREREREREREANTKYSTSFLQRLKRYQGIIKRVSMRVSTFNLD
jgi:hypothetical protein